ncbi:Short-chain-enoyl-CoA hydratase [Pandoraea eparura]|uniref:Short-chain-enoyl-CoA hydratase n=1 Tax=Pandoraea eparura TaxID=2508291 RepID=A0A5E4U5Z1_9BURK|nr:enoyl-CoA hydratase-related protein [Pandoraea eparura]VVD95486.1 Short-chain-enoyl-CoA hydratase [Pandoraea eparura]
MNLSLEGGVVVDRDIVVEAVNGVALVRLNREAKRNALTLALWKRLGATFSQLDANIEVRSIVLTGTGASFCAGADISEFNEARGDPEQAVVYESAYDDCCDAIAATSKPTIAAINGFCMGGGCNVAMSCDFRIAVPSAEFAIPAARLSIVYGVKGTRRLFNLVGLSNAKHILCSARRFDAERALRIGFVDEVAPDALESALQFAMELASNAPLTIKGAKYILNSLANTENAISASTVNHLMDEAAQSHDYMEGRTAFAEKRPPQFRGY